jgi:hypothetical protein
VRHDRTTWSPAETTEGVAVICAVGACTVGGGGAVSTGNGGCFFLQPATANNATTKTAGTRMREGTFKGGSFRFF